MSDAIRSQLDDLQEQVSRTASAIEEFGRDRGKRRRAWRRARNETKRFGRQAGQQVREHPAAVGLVMLGISAVVAACLLQGRRDGRG